MMTLFSNPTKGNSSINLGVLYKEVYIRVLSLNGKFVYHEAFNGTKMVKFTIIGEIGRPLFKYSLMGNQK
ncbi:MAG: hypothetical protein HRT58_04440 [Crocinitomicaceae bacterium]|nr:hypothetical protein [Flavobacteriales bacterium]NQZ34885.1 hypothetical protein [Crocinitomicaceae bacterium]